LYASFKTVSYGARQSYVPRLVPLIEGLFNQKAPQTPSRTNANADVAIANARDLVTDAP